MFMTEYPMSILSLIAVAIGLFYALSGLLFLHALVFDHWADALLEALGDKDAKKETKRTRLLTLSAGITLVSGLSLATLSPWSPMIFAGSALFQGVHLLWAARAYPPQDDVERRGRRNTVNAFFSIWPPLPSCSMRKRRASGVIGCFPGPIGAPLSQSWRRWWVAWCCWR